MGFDDQLIVSMCLWFVFEILINDEFCCKNETKFLIQPKASAYLIK